MKFGINQSNLLQLSASDMDRVCKDMADFGFESVRFSVDWAQLAGYWGFSLDLTKVMLAAKTLQVHGLVPMPIFGVHLPGLLKKSPDDFRVFVQKCMEIFGPLPYVEVWNEPNLLAFNVGGPTNYLKYLRAADAALRPYGSKVIHGGLAAYSSSKTLLGQNWSPLSWYSEILQAGEIGGIPAYDLLGMHPYPITNALLAKWVDPASTQAYGMAQLAALDEKRALVLDSRPYAFTEIGYDTSACNMPQAVAWLTWQLQYFEKYYPNAPQWLFTWRDTVGDGGSYGLVDKNNKPKQPYYLTVKGYVVNGLPD